MSAGVWRGRALSLVIAAALLGACSAPAGTHQSVSFSGQPVAEARTVAVPALWANSKGQSGMEYAKVTVGTVGEPGFGIDLTDQQADGAGPQWLAASAAAAAVATIWSGVDPAVVDVGYQVTGPIDGPSAGGVLAVGTLAAINDDALRPDVTMTGTIGPDGTIGPVGGIEHKLRAAAEAGFTTVLIPERNAQAGRTGTDLVAAGRALGLTVRPIGSLLEAYAAFTGVDLAGADCDPAVDSAVQAAADALPAPQTPPATQPDAAEIAERAAALAAESARFTASILSDPAHPVTGLARNQLSALPALLAPAVRAEALADAAAQWAAAHPRDDDGLVTAARVVDFAAGSLAQSPRAIAAWRALPRDVEVNAARAVPTGTAYATLLTTAATATTQYLRTVFEITPEADDGRPLIAIPVAAGAVLAERADSSTHASTADLSTAVLQATEALAAWTLNQQAHGLVSEQYGPAGVELSTRTAVALARTSACRAESRGLDPSWPVWSTRTALDAATSAPDSDRRAAWLAAGSSAAAAQVSLSMLTVQGLDTARAATAG